MAFKGINSGDETAIVVTVYFSTTSQPRLLPEKLKSPENSRFLCNDLSRQNPQNGTNVDKTSVT